MASVALCVVAGGARYVEYADRLFESAREFFWPLPDREFKLIAGDEGWPNGTMFRPVHLLLHFPSADYVYLCDADMRFEGHVGPEILPPGKGGIVATRHPGYFGWSSTLPFEDRPDSACYVAPEKRQTYYCGGFWGGSRELVKNLAFEMVKRIDRDVAHGITPVWHDEAALNAVLADWGGPDLGLTPAYCHPDSDEFYVAHVWGEQLPRLLVALDKPAEERCGR